MSQLQNSHRVRICGWLLAATLVGIAAPLAVLAQTSMDAAATRSSIAQGVTIKVTPKLIGSADTRWEFAIVLDSHGADLSGNLIQTATLTTDDGSALKPVSWTGAPAGGHHREGVLAFDVPAPRPSAIELRIARQGESAPRTFRWQL